MECSGIREWSCRQAWNQRVAAVTRIDAFWMLDAQVVAPGSRAIGRSRIQALREKWTHLLRVRYTPGSLRACS
jgi:hypothetical protein